MKFTEITLPTEIIKPGDIFTIHSFDDGSAMLDGHLKKASGAPNYNTVKVNSYFKYFTASSSGYGSGDYTLQMARNSAGQDYRVYRLGKTLEMNAHYSEPLPLP